MKKTFRVVVVVLIVLVAIVAAGTWVWWRGGLPVRTGEHSLAGLDAAVDVRFDRWGVPYIAAESSDDLLAALGWLHANDRFTQMELGRRAAAGRLAEILGEPVVETDVYFRTLRLTDVAAAMWDASSPEARRWLESYAAGVNAWLAERDGDFSPELRLLGHEPEPWTALDSLAFAGLMARDLSFWDARPEEKRFVWLRHFGVDGVRDLLGDPDVHVADEILALAQQGQEPADVEGKDATPSELDLASPGSNNWAIAPERTEMGRAIVANDPHLGLHLPSVWYQVHLRAPGYEAAGMSLPGTPGVVIGRGPAVAWAMTNVMLDDHDLYFERLSDDGRRYQRGDTWLDVEERQETIRIRGGGEQALTLRTTDRGPLLDPDDELNLPARSLEWTAYIPSDPISAFHGLARATTPAEAFAAVRSYGCPAQNLVMAFATGEIAYAAIGAIPARRTGDGRLPSPGWDLAYGWDGLRRRETNPAVVDPDAGFIVTANQDIRPPGYELPVVAEFYPGHRAERIREALAARETWSFEAAGDLQTDVRSLYARDLIKAIAGSFDIAAPEDDAAEAYGALAGWNQTMGGTGPAALFALVQRELFERVFGDDAEIAGLPTRSVGRRGVLLRVLQGETATDWIDDRRTPEVEGRDAVVAEALAAAWSEGRTRWGDRVTKWPYEELHQLTLRHRLDAMPVVGGWMRRGPFDLPGSGTTVAAFGARWSGDRLQVTYGPSMRWIVDWSQPDVAFAALPGGQSGHPADPHYDDQVRRFLDGKLHPAPWAEGPIEARGRVAAAPLAVDDLPMSLSFPLPFRLSSE